MMLRALPLLFALSCSTEQQQIASPPDLKAYQFDPFNCGRSGNICPRHDMGIVGPYREICCEGECIDHLMNSDHCGNCRTSCGGTLCCQSNCVNSESYKTDPFNCGTCGYKCQVASCVGGVCGM